MRGSSSKCQWKSPPFHGPVCRIKLYAGRVTTVSSLLNSQCSSLANSSVLVMSSKCLACWRGNSQVSYGNRPATAVIMIQRSEARTMRSPSANSRLMSSQYRHGPVQAATSAAIAGGTLGSATICPCACVSDAPARSVILEVLCVGEACVTQSQKAHLDDQEHSCELFKTQISYRRNVMRAIDDEFVAAVAGFRVGPHGGETIRHHAHLPSGTICLCVFANREYLRRRLALAALAQRAVAGIVGEFHRGVGVQAQRSLRRDQHPAIDNWIFSQLRKLAHYALRILRYSFS